MNYPKDHEGSKMNVVKAVYWALDVLNFDIK